VWDADVLSEPKKESAPEVRPADGIVAVDFSRGSSAHPTQAAFTHLRTSLKTSQISYLLGGAVN
jgi:hypothetical protein